MYVNCRALGGEYALFMTIILGDTHTRIIANGFYLESPSSCYSYAYHCYAYSNTAGTYQDNSLMEYTDNTVRT